ncbi:MAG TPA: GPR1/FUN34/YaaH family transporter [Gaiellales bacterium]|nr:GPR1/FUN34/YaaH family transporter [Gaiellales bacterium]
MAEMDGHAIDGRRSPVRITLRPLASPLPLGFFAFSIGSFLFSTVELGWIPAAEAKQLAIVMIVFVGPLELIAAVLAFWARDPGGATALGLFGMTWETVGVIEYTATAPRSVMLGTFMLSVSALVLAFAASAFAAKPALTAVGLLAAARFAITGVYEIHGGARWEHTSGWIGLPLSAAAFYLAFALMLEDANHRTVLPLMRRGSARAAIEGDLGGQVRAIEREAGVRGQL